MKRTGVSLLALLCMVGGLAVAADQPTGFDIVVTDVISAADTVATATRADTSVSSTALLMEFQSLQFYVGLDADTNWTDDTIFVALQSSFDESYWNTYDIDTLLTSDTTMPAVILKADSNVVGPYVRFRAIHWDSTEADMPGQVTNSYDYTVRVEMRVLK